MASHILQDGSGLLPRGMFRLIALEDENSPQFLTVSHHDMPIFGLVFRSSPTASGISGELMNLLCKSRSTTGICYYLVETLSNLDVEALQNRLRHLSAKIASTVIWLGPSQDDSNAALRLLTRLFDNQTSILTQRLWSRREGQAVLALAQRATWKRLVPRIIASCHDVSIAVGEIGVSWEAIVNFGGILLQLGAHGRMEHQHFAHALLVSEASKVIQAVAAVEFSCPTEITSYPPPVPRSTITAEAEASGNALLLGLESTIAAAERRWMMLEHDVQLQSAVRRPSEDDLDAEIARYSHLLQQIDVMDADLETLKQLTGISTIYCSQAELRTPQASPEIMP